MSIQYVSNQLYSIYDPSLSSYWFSVNRYYSITYPYRDMGSLHAHTEAEIMYIQSGKCTVNLEESQIQLREGNYIFLDSMVPHSITIEENSPCHVLNIEAALTKQDSILRLDSLLKEKNFRSFQETCLPALLCRDDEGAVKNGLLNLHRLLLHKDSLIEADFQLSLILLEIGRQCSLNRVKNPQGSLAYIKRALNYIAQNYDHEITVDDVAIAAGISKAHLQRAFRSSQGCTIVDMINRFRLDKAKLLLASSNSPIIEIANEVGFSSRQYFTDLFARMVGISPARYRKHRRGNIAVGFENSDLEDMGVTLHYT